MNDQEADMQVMQMINFIKNEAKQTAEEVEQKTYADFNVEKVKLVQSLKESIRSEYEAKKKKSVTAKAIERSSAINRARLSKIEARHECIEMLSGECAKKLADVAKTQDKYKAILIDLIVQGALKLMEPQITVKCRQTDAALVKSVLDTAANKYAQVMKQGTGASVTCKLSLDSSALAPSSLGGVVLSCQGGSILVDNTLDARLRLAMESERPAIRKMIFPRA